MKLWDSVGISQIITNPELIDDRTLDIDPSSPGSAAGGSFAFVSSEAPGTVQCLYNDVLLYILTDCRLLPGHK